MLRADQQDAERDFHTDVVWHNTAQFPGQRICVGPQAIIDFWETLVESFHERSVTIERVLEGENSVVLGVHSVGEGLASGVPIDVHWALALRVRDGRISRVDVHGDWANALQAAGLGE